MERFFFYCLSTLVISGINKPIYWNLTSISRDYTTLPYHTVKHAQTVGVNDLSCLEDTE